MSSLTAPRPPVKPNRKPLSPASVRAYLVGGASRQDILDGSAVLSVTDLNTGDEKAYWLAANYDGERCVGFSLVTFGGGEKYDLPRDLSSCTCPDNTFKPERPGGCRHMQALRQALPTVARG
ncbi:MAG TPA: hypothetical protein VFW33_21115 [Gemmataceae bacterium]|nr:hypothetical protein [Gemmataceae bacterium]